MKCLYLGTCHGYTQQRGRTGGLQDCYCPHLFKIGTKVEAIQESVADPSNLIHSMKKRPVLHICDDPCTLVEYERAHYPADSMLCLGDRKGGLFQHVNSALFVLLNEMFLL